MFNSSIKRKRNKIINTLDSETIQCAGCNKIMKKKNNSNPIKPKYIDLNNNSMYNYIAIIRRIIEFKKYCMSAFKKNPDIIFGLILCIDCYKSYFAEEKWKYTKKNIIDNGYNMLHAYFHTRRDYCYKPSKYANIVLWKKLIVDFSIVIWHRLYLKVRLWWYC